MNDAPQPTPTPTPSPTPSPTPAPGSPPSSPTPASQVPGPDDAAARAIAEEVARRAQATPPTPEPPKTPPPDPGDTRATPYKMEEMKLPDGVEIHQPSQESFVKLVNEHAIPRKTVDALLNLQADVMKAASEMGSKAFTDLQAAWQDEVQKHPTIGGAHLQGHLANIGKLIDFAGPVLSPKVRAAFDLTGAGNHPAIVEWLSGIAKELVESGHISGGPPLTPGAAADRIYDGKK